MSLTVDVHGAADMMKIHYQSVLDLIGAGVLPAAKIGRAYVLLTRDVMDHIEAEIVRQTASRMRRPAEHAIPKPWPRKRVVGRTKAFR